MTGKPAESLSYISLKAAIMLDNLLNERPTSEAPIRRLLEALDADQPDLCERTRNLVSDYRRVSLYSRAWKVATGASLNSVSEVGEKISELLDHIQKNLQQSSKTDVERARDFCLALSRQIVNSEYEGSVNQHPLSGYGH